MWILAGPEKQEKESLETTNTYTTDKSVVEKNDSNVKTEVKTTVDDKNKIKTVKRYTSQLTQVKKQV
jgi:hypothetical protein